jgi:hypothetical protein
VAFRLAFTAVAVAIMIWLLATGHPLGGLVIVPLLAIWVRQRFESADPR